MGIKLEVGNLQTQLIQDYAPLISQIFESVKNKTAVGSEMTGWIDWVDNKKEHQEIIQKTTEIAKNWKDKGVEKIVLIGTGGSYIGCRGGLEFSRKCFGNKDFEFIYVPYFSDKYLTDLLGYLSEVKFAVVVISKSGTTLEPAIAFRLIRELLAKKEGDNYKDFVIAITDKAKGILKGIADKEKFHTFVIKDDIGGRFSTISSVGLVPMVLGGVDVERVLEGARQAKKDNLDGEIAPNKASLYAAYRHFMFENKHLVNECLISYDPQLKFTLEAIKQLFGESEGKSNKGLMPIVLDYPLDIHSIGQFIQEGNKSFFESTFLVKDSSNNSLKINNSSFNNDDNLDALTGKSLQEINDICFNSAFDLHSNSAWINNVIIELDSWNPENFGYLYFWSCLVAMFSSYLFGVNPFNQPGVETYKKRMFTLLGKN